MGKDLFQIILDNQQAVYFPGRMVTGRVHLKLEDDMKVRDISMKFYGYAHVQWSEQRTTHHHGSHHHGSQTETVTYSARENYFKYQAVLFGKEQTGQDSVKLKEATYDFPFSFQLPPSSPSSYEAAIGRVRYYLEATINRPWAFNKNFKALITVINLLDLNTMPHLVNGATSTDSKTLCCLCCESDPISATVMVERTGYVAGEAITFNAEVNNMSKRHMSKSEAQLVMEVKYMAEGHTKTVRNVLHSLRHGRIDAGGSDIWMNEKLFIPPVPPSYLRGCNIIDIRYYATLRVNPSGPALDLYVPVEVVIGSIPLRHIAEQHGLTLPPAPPPLNPSAPPPPYPGAPTGLYTDTQMPSNMPNVSFAESAFGRVNTTEEGETYTTEGNKDFAPVYTYYDWGKRDPATNFAVQTNEGVSKSDRSV